MRVNQATRMVPACLMAGLLMVAGTAKMKAQEAEITARPLTHQDIHDYGLPAGTQPSGGLFAVGLGQPAYLEVLLPKAVTNFLNVSWSITAQPGTNVLEVSPLGPSVPIYEPRDREDYQLADRRMLRPTTAGQYTVTATVFTNGGSFVLTRKITAGTYMGINTCALCHSGGVIAPNKVTPWSATGHATFFTEAIDGLKSSHYNSGCIQCHVVGYDTNAIAKNGGFDDIAATNGWMFPAVLTNGNWAAMPSSLKNVANIQCESCHGAGSQHAPAAIFDPEGSKDLIHVNYNSGDCAQCHSEEPYHVFPLQWENSKHAVAVREESTSCVGCHQGIGFIDRTKGVAQNQRRTEYTPINCAACHEPHDATNPHQLRSLANVTLMDTSRVGGATVVTNGGQGKLCMQCHISRRDAVTYAQSYHDHYGPHHGPQTDMLVGANAITYGKEIPSSAHREVVDDACVTCHMQETSRNNPEHLFAGGHTWNMAWDSGSNRVELVEACMECHGEVEGFDFKRQDFDGNGIVEGVQSEVKGLLSKLAIMLPPVGVPKPNHSPDNLAVDATWTQPQLKAAYNYLFVVEDGSYGVHNLSYAVGLLKASIADLSGDANNDGLADWWQAQYFGANWASNPNAAPNATPLGDGIPNWLKFALGLNPNVAGLVLPDGVVWANTGTTGGTNNAIRIYTAAEIVFDTEAGKTYQIQAVSNLGGGWQNVGSPIPGTGQSMSYVTPTRSNAQQFYRVMRTP